MASRDEVYLKFGITAEAAQLLETSLGTLLLALEGLHKGWFMQPQPAEAWIALERVEKSTLGTLFKEVQQLVNFEGDLPAFFASALKTRNRLFHGFYERHNFKIQTDEGRDEMIADLEEMHTELFTAWQVADAMSTHVLLLMDALTDYDSWDRQRLEQFHHSIEKAPGKIPVGPGAIALVEKHWPSLLEKLIPMQFQAWTETKDRPPLRVGNGGL